MIDTRTLAEATLEEIPDLTLRLLEAGARRAAAPFHTGEVANVTPDGPRVRTVVLRRVDGDPGQLVFHTDRRSPKFRELSDDPRLAWHFYARELKLQLRLGGTATLHTDDDLADTQWARSRPSSRECYRAALGPGTALAADGPVDISGDGRAHFAVVAGRLTTLDWLFLRHQGHRRARFARAAAGWRGEWIAP